MSTGRAQDPDAPRPALAPLRLALGALAALLLLSMMGVTVADVIGRYLLNRPLPGAPEITELLLCATIFVGLAPVCLDDGHITVDLVTEQLSDGLRSLALLAGRLVTVGALGLIGWRLWLHGDRLARFGDTSIYLRLPIAPVAYGAAALCLFSAALVLLLVLLRAREGGLLPPRR